MEKSVLYPTVEEIITQVVKILGELSPDQKASVLEALEFANANLKAALDA